MGGEGSLRRIVLLYNDRNRPTVSGIRSRLDPLLSGAGLQCWLAYEDMTMWGDIFEQIEGAIETAAGVVIFLGAEGLGRFQQNIEMGAVNTEIWQQGHDYGRLLVHLTGGLTVPRQLLRWPTVNHDGILTGEEAIADAIAQRLQPRPAQAEKLA
jgi:hypothetical protein